MSTQTTLPNPWLQWQRSTIDETIAATGRFFNFPTIVKRAQRIRKGISPSEVVYEEDRPICGCSGSARQSMRQLRQRAGFLTFPPSLNVLNASAKAFPLRKSFTKRTVRSVAAVAALDNR